MRHPTDVQRLAIGLVVTIVGFFLATYLNTINEAITVEVINGLGAAPKPVIILAVITLDFLALRKLEADDIL